jgi:hypothetical protein
MTEYYDTTFGGKRILTALYLTLELLVDVRTITT